jgi:hypothetical protein
MKLLDGSALAKLRKLDYHARTLHGHARWLSEKRDEVRLEFRRLEGLADQSLRDIQVTEGAAGKDRLRAELETARAEHKRLAAEADEAWAVASPARALVTRLTDWLGSHGYALPLEFASDDALPLAAATPEAAAAARNAMERVAGFVSGLMGRDK